LIDTKVTLKRHLTFLRHKGYGTEKQRRRKAVAMSQAKIEENRARGKRRTRYFELFYFGQPRESIGFELGLLK